MRWGSLLFLVFCYYHLQGTLTFSIILFSTGSNIRDLIVINQDIIVTNSSLAKKTFCFCWCWCKLHIYNDEYAKIMMMIENVSVLSLQKIKFLSILYFIISNSFYPEISHSVHILLIRGTRESRIIYSIPTKVMQISYTWKIYLNT